MRIFRNPKHAGEVKNPSGIGKVGNLKCGDVMFVYIKVKDNIIKDIKYKTMGCAAAIASSEALCELSIGKTLEQAEKIKDKDIANYLGGLPKIKYHCSILGARGLHEAIKNYKNRKNN